MQLIALASMAAGKEYTLATGTIATLRGMPVDPCDMFRGDYVRLGYEISSLPVQTQLRNGSEVYVVLKRAVPYWKADTLSETLPKLLPDEVALKARVDTEDDFRWRSLPPGTAHLRYGLEQHYVPEGTGMALQQARHLCVQVAVDKFGNAVIKSVAAER